MMAAETTATTTASDRKWQLLIFLPYFVGIIWACLTPTVSILSGGKCRGWYIDENSLETSNLRSDHRYLATNLPIINDSTRDTSTLCGALGAFVHVHGNTNIDCHRHDGLPNSAISFDFARVLPTRNTVEPSNEAIALIAPAPLPSEDWSTSLFHSGLIEVLELLASSKTQWLAKTILLVSPTTNEHSLDTVVDLFLNSYNGSYNSTAKETFVETLPPPMVSAMIRNLLVLDCRLSDDPLSTKDEIRVLPQGEHGVLPNLDLVFVTYSVFSRSPSSGNTRRSSNDAKAPTLVMHSLGEKRQYWESFVSSLVEKFPKHDAIAQWAKELGDLALFARSLFRGPYAAHSLALRRGIDAITIEGRHIAKMPKSFVADYIQKLEITLHGLSNLHERLHHSTALYLMPSPAKFVKHEEYLIPNLLLLIPAVLRAAFLGLRDIRRFDLQIIGWLLVITITFIVTLDVVVAQQDSIERRNAWLALTYAACLWIFYEKVLRKSRQRYDRNDALQSAQLVTCLVGIYVHVPICFGHVSLSYPSALFWAPWVAFPSFTTLYQKRTGTFVMMSWLIAFWPPVMILRLVFSDSLTPYIRFVYFPLHLLLSLSCMIGVATS